MHCYASKEARVWAVPNTVLRERHMAPVVLKYSTDILPSVGFWHARGNLVEPRVDWVLLLKVRIKCNLIGDK